MDLSILVLGSHLQARQAYKRLCGVLREKGSPQAHMFDCCAIYTGMVVESLGSQPQWKKLSLGVSQEVYNPALLPVPSFSTSRSSNV